MSRSNREFQLSLSHQKTHRRRIDVRAFEHKIDLPWLDSFVEQACPGESLRLGLCHHRHPFDLVAVALAERGPTTPAIQIPTDSDPTVFSETCPEPVLAKSAFSHENRGYTTEVRTHRARTSHTRCHAIYSGSVWCPGFISAAPSTAAAELSHCAHLHPRARLHSTDALTTSPLLPVLLAVRFL